MVLRQSVVDAFNVLGITPDTPEEVAKTTYKKLALTHHPDRNYGDSNRATQRFQQIGHAWQICQRHYEHPEWSEEPSPDTRHTHDPFNSPSFSFDDDPPLDDEEAGYFFRFMFAEMLFNRYTYAKGRRFRSERTGATGGGGLFAFSPSFAESQTRQEDSKRKEKDEYMKRFEELEREMASEQAEKERIAHELAKHQEKLANAYQRAFSLGRAGNVEGMKALIEEHQLDVTTPERPRKTKSNQKQSDEYETMLHVAARSSDETLVQFLLRKGANPASLNPDMLTPFQVSILAGNKRVVQWFMDQHRRKPMDGCHPSKAAADAARRTPLQLALASGVPEIVQMLINDATVHDVKRCWAILQKKLSTAPSDDEHTSPRLKIRDILLKKNGFSPDSEAKAKEKAQSKSALRKAAQAKAEAEAAARKVKLRAEEDARAAAKREEEESRKRLEEERERRQAAEIEAKRLAEERAVQKARAEIRSRRIREEEARKAAEKEARRLAEEARKAAEEEERRRLEVQNRKAVENEARRWLEEQKRKAAENEARMQAQEARKAAEEEERRRQEEKKRRAAEKEARRQAQEARKAAEREARRREEEARRLDDERRKAAEEEAQARKAAEEAARLLVEAEARRKAAELTAAQGTRSRAISEPDRPTKVNGPKRKTKPTHASMSGLDIATEVMQARAEQSARDKARHQCLMEGKKLAALKIDVPETRANEPNKTRTSPPTALNNVPNLDHSRVSSFSPTSATSDFPRTPHSYTPPRQFRSNAYGKLPDMVSSVAWASDGLDIQTCTTPDSLFIYEPFTPQPVRSTSAYHHYDHAASSSSASVDGSVSTSTRGRGWRRGGGRHGRGQYSHVNGDGHRHQGPGPGPHSGEQRGSVHAATVSQLEAEIAQKDLELTRLRAMLNDRAKN